MIKRKKGSCTTILVGKNASIDGSTIVARNDDGYEDLDPQSFVIVHPENQPRIYQSVNSNVEVPLTEKPRRYTSVPNTILTSGIWAAGGINRDNVAMSATETITTNSRIQGIDPYILNGLGEEDFVTLILPYIESAKEGVERLGNLLKKYGTYESNGIAFSDKNEIWWLETIGGHHWAAVRIPDDGYVIAPNRMNIDKFNFDSDNTLYSEGLQDIITTNNLNPDFEGNNLRHIFGSSSLKDMRYSNPRTWYGQMYFNPEVNYDPTDHDIPFICHANRKITIEDVKFVLSSHFENTKYDPYGHGTESEKKMMRTIGINSNHNIHILQIRNNVPFEIAGIHWLAYGPNTFNVVVPFYSNVNDTPLCYRSEVGDFDLNNMYWLSCVTAVLGDYNYNFYVNYKNTFEVEAMSKYRQIQNETDKISLGKKNICNYLETVNNRLAEESLKRQLKLFENMIINSVGKMKLRFYSGIANNIIEISHMELKTFYLKNDSVTK